jgi:eukaryotic-like serine/threonine-protein kinase
MKPPETPATDLPLDPEEEHLVQVLEGYLNDLESGRPVDPQRLLAEHPSIAPRLHSCLAGLRLLGDASGHPTISSAVVGKDFGEYTILRDIGRGGMGIVYEAEHRQQRRRCALKIIPQAAALDPRQLLRFKNEAQAASRLHHPHIVPVYDIGFADGCPFYTMQLVAGSSLAQWIQERRQRNSDATQDPGDYRAAADYVRQAAVALDHAHQVGIIHRDVKPANLLVQADGHLWVTDFGLASVQEGDGLTATGDVVGTLRYMSPEQASARRGVVDHRTDIYALGATLYELLTLQPAVHGLDRQQLLEQLSFGVPRPLRRIDPRIPVELETIALKTLAHAPEDRYATAASLADDLARYLAGQPIHARRPGWLARAIRWVRRRPSLAAAGGLVVLLLAVLLAISTTVIWRALQAEERQRALAEVRELDSRRHAYDAEMNLAFAEWQSGHLARVLELLKRQQPLPWQEDLRGFEWHYLSGLCLRANKGALRGHQGRVEAIAVHDRGWITAADDGTIRIWDPHTGGLQSTIHAGAEKIWALASAPHSNRLVAALGHQKIRWFDLRTNQPQDGAVEPTGKYTAAAMSRDGSTLVFGGTPLIVVREPFERVELTGQNDLPNCIAVNANGTFVVAVGNDRKVRLWDLTSPAPSQSTILGEHSTYIVSAAMSPDGQTLLTGSEDGFVRKWNLVSREAAGPPERRHLGAVSGAAFSPDGQLAATVSWDGSVEVWDASSGEVLHQYGHPGQVRSVAFAADGETLLTGGEDGLVQLWDLTTPAHPLVLEGHSSLIRGLAFSPDSQRLFSASADGSARRWDLAGGATSVVLAGDQYAKTPQWMATRNWTAGADAGWKMGVAFLPQADQVLTADLAGRIRVHESQTGREVRRFEEAGGPIWQVALSPDGETVAAAGYRSNTVHVWDVATGKKRFELCGHTERVWSVAFSPDGRRLASAAADRTLRCWDVVSGQSQAPIDIPAEFPWSLAFSPDGRTLAVTTDDCRIHLWDVATARELEPIGRHAATIRVLAFFPDGKSLVCGGDDGTVKIWGLATRQERATLRGSGPSIWSLAVSRDGSAVAIGDKEGRITVWDTPLPRQNLQP